MKVLFICLNNFPHSGACSSLLSNIFSTEILQKDMEIHVLTIKSSITDVEYEIIDGIRIHRILCWESISGRELFETLWENPFTFLRGLLYKITSKVGKWIDHNPFLIYQKLHALNKRLEVLKYEGYDVLIPVAGQYENVEAALQFKAQNEVKLIVYQVDPCSTNMSFAARNYSRRRSLEKRIMNSADMVVTTPLLYEQWEKDYPLSAKDKVIKMEFPNVNPKNQKRDEIRKERKERDIDCVFAGSLYREARNPAYTLKLFGALNGTGIKLSIIGAEKDNMREFLNEEDIASNISFYGCLPLKEAQQHMEQSDVLVNIGNIMTNQVPSKIFEYISQGKPIVNVCVNHNCPSLPYLEKYPYVLNLFEGEDTDEQVQKLKEFIREYAGQRVPAEYIAKEYETCTAAYCARQMVEIICLEGINKSI